MATPALNIRIPPSTTGGLTGIAVDRWIYVFMAAMFVVITLGGFIPDSLMRIAEIEAGRRRPFTPMLHVHAVVMGGWLMLLLTQTYLVATGQRAYHRTLGLTSLVLAPLVVLVMGAVAADGWRALYSAPPPVPPEVLAQMKTGIANVLLAQGRAIFYFALFFIWAVAVRKSDGETHKRMMILATVVLVPAAIARMRWLPSSMPASYDALHAYMLLCLAPVLIRDTIRLGRPHRAYLIGLALMAPWIIAMHFLWNSPWWQQTARKLMGVEGL